MARLMPDQRSLYEQLLDLVDVAEGEYGMYDAADWVKARWNERQHTGEPRL